MMEEIFQIFDVDAIKQTQIFLSRTSVFNWSAFFQFRLKSLGIIPSYIFFYIIKYFLFAFIFILINKLCFKFSKKASYASIIIIISFSRHALYQIILFQNSFIRTRHVMTLLIAMYNQGFLVCFIVFSTNSISSELLNL